MTSAVPNSQYKTSAIITNESLAGFEDTFEFLSRVSHTYEELIASVSGLPTNGTISIRRPGLPELQYGLSMGIVDVAQDYETIRTSTDDMMGTAVSIDPVSLMVSRNKVTDTTHYSISQQIASAANMQCYNRLILGANMFVGDASSTTINSDTITSVNTLQDTMNIPSSTTSLFLSTSSYASLSKNIMTLNTFDAEINRDNIGFKVNEYMGQPIVRSSTLDSIAHVSFYADGKDLAFGVLTSTDTDKSCVITLTGGVDGDILQPGDRLQFATTKRINRSTKMATYQPLQLVVQNTVTAAGGGIFTGVQCVAGINAMAVSPNANWFANVLATPSTGEVVRVMGSYRADFATVKPGFTFCTVNLPPMKTLDIPAWDAGKTEYSMTPGVRRNQETKDAPVQIYTSFDADVLERVFYMRLDMQPVYKAFVDYNIAILTPYAGADFMTLKRNGIPTFIEKCEQLKKKFAGGSEKARMLSLETELAASREKFELMQRQIAALSSNVSSADGDNIVSQLKAQNEAFLKKEAENARVMKELMAKVEMLSGVTGEGVKAAKVSSKQS